MNTQQKPNLFNRAKTLQLFAIGKQQLGWDDEFYRGIWLPMQGATKDEEDRYSAKTLSNTQLMRGLEDMKRLGFTPKSKKAGNRTLADDAQSKKIRALWLELHAAGKVRDASGRALAHWVAGQVKSSKGVEALQWLDSAQAGRIIEQLKKWLARKPAEAKA